MGKKDFKGVLKEVQTSLAKHSPEILTGIGIAGMVTTVVLAVRATPKAMRLIEDEKNRQNEALAEQAKKDNLEKCPQVDKIKAKDAVKVAWKCYIPAAITGATSIACLIGATSVSARRNAALAAAYKLSESALIEYKDKVIETIGEKKEQAIRDEINKDRVKENPVNKNEVIITGKGDTLCLDYQSRRYFKSDIDKIKRAINEVNAKLLRDSYVSLNELYWELGLEGSSTGDRMGWNVDKGLIEAYFTSELDSEGTPCLVMDFRNPPEYNFDKMF